MSNPWLHWVGFFTRLAAYMAAVYGVYLYAPFEAAQKPLATVTLAEILGCMTALGVIFFIFRAFDTNKPDDGIYEYWGRIGVFGIVMLALGGIWLLTQKLEHEKAQHDADEYVRVQAERQQARDALTSGLLKKAKEYSPPGQ